MTPSPADALFLLAPAAWFGASLAVGGLSLLRRGDAPPEPPMKIECVVVCVNYSDFFAFSLPANKPHFDRMVVVTSPADKATQRLCEYWHVQCIQTDAFYADGQEFNKGAGINEGLKALGGDAWVLHMDADIILPPQFRRILEQLELDEESLYSVDRLMCDNFKDWLAHWYKPTCQNEADIYVHLKPFAAGTRIARADKEYGGWVPLGFFQMWHQGRKKLTYPDRHGDAGRSDLLFSLKFPRAKRNLLAEIVAIHLETKMAEGGKMGANWAGRKTPLFGAEVLGDDFLQFGASEPVVAPPASADAREPHRDDRGGHEEGYEPHDEKR